MMDLRRYIFKLFTSRGTDCSQSCYGHSLNLPEGDDFRLALRGNNKIRLIDDIYLAFEDRECVNWELVVLCTELVLDDFNKLNTVALVAPDFGIVSISIPDNANKMSQIWDYRWYMVGFRFLVCLFVQLPTRKHDEAEQGRA